MEDLIERYKVDGQISKEDVSIIESSYKEKAMNKINSLREKAIAKETERQKQRGYADSRLVKTTGALAEIAAQVDLKNITEEDKQKEILGSLELRRDEAKKVYETITSEKKYNVLDIVRNVLATISQSENEKEFAAGLNAVYSPESVE